MKTNYLLAFLITIFILVSLPSHLEAQVENAYRVTDATILTFIYDRCTGQDIGTRTYTINAFFDPSSQKLNGTLSITGVGTIAGANQNYLRIEGFPIYGFTGERIGVIPSAPPNFFPQEIPFSLNLNSPPKLIKATISQIVTAGVCNGVFQDSDEFSFEGDVTNGTFQIPCPVVNKFEVTPNPVQPGGQVTVEWDVTNLFQSRFIRFSGPNLPPTDRSTQTGTLTFQAPSTPGDYEYTLEIFDVNGTKLDCLPPAKRTLTVSGGRYFWLVKRMNPLAPATPYLSPFEYYSETLAVPTPPGTNPTTSFVRIPATGDFEAATPEAAAKLESFKTQVFEGLYRMKVEDYQRIPPPGLITPEKNQAVADYRNALESYRQALAAFQNAQPKSGSGLVGPGNLGHARKTSEEISPYDN